MEYKDVVKAKTEICMYHARRNIFEECLIHQITHSCQHCAEEADKHPEEIERIAREWRREMHPTNKEILNRIYGDNTPWTAIENRDSFWDREYKGDYQKKDPVTSEWEKTDQKGFYRCKRCGDISGPSITRQAYMQRYCPNCGALMEKEEKIK